METCPGAETYRRRLHFGHSCRRCAVVTSARWKPSAASGAWTSQNTCADVPARPIEKVAPQRHCRSVVMEARLALTGRSATGAGV